jgi:hypothetical protein
MNAPRLLTGEDVKVLIEIVRLVPASLEDERNVALKILTEPRTEALGLSKEEWTKISIFLETWGGSPPSAVATGQIASSLTNQENA